MAHFHKMAEINKIEYFNSIYFTYICLLWLTWNKFLQKTCFTPCSFCESEVTLKLFCACANIRHSESEMLDQLLKRYAFPDTFNPIL